jgi:hypothetical protein
LLAPEEQEVDFRASLTDSAAIANLDEGHEYRYQPTSIRRERGNTGVMTPRLSQSHNLEMALASRSKGSTGPDDPMAMQVPPRDHGNSGKP